MKRWKRILSMLLICCLVVGMLPMTALAATDASGSCGTGVRWSYDSNSKTLTISGTGKMADYDHEWGENEAPWYDSYRTEIETVVVESGVTRIGNEAFSGGAYRSGYPNLTSVSIADSVKEIGSYAFAGASALTSLTLPSSLTSIGNSAFHGSGLKEITIPTSVDDIGSSAFAECASLSAINVASGNTRYISDEGVLYEKLLGDGKSLLCYPVKKTASSYSVLAGTSEIAEEAFAGNTYLFSVTIPSTVQELPPTAFLFCTSLYTVSLPEGMSSVDSSAFWGCLVLSELHIPASVTSFTTEYAPADAWLGAYVSNLSVYFSGAAAPDFDRGIADLHGASNTKVTIYYPTGSTGWSAVQAQEDVSSAVSRGAMEFQTWTPSSGGEVDADNSNVPIIFIPGIMGSKLYTDQELTDIAWGTNAAATSSEIGQKLSLETLYTTELTKEYKGSDSNEYGTVDTSKAIIDYLCDKYPDRNVYLFSYDWRKSNIDSAAKLANAIKELGVSKVDLICHSMGGLVAAQYINTYGESTVDHIITLGTPYEGAPKLLEAVLTNNVLNDIIILGGIDISGIANSLMYNHGLTRDVKASFAGVAELSPTIEYWSSVSDNYILPAEDCIKIADIVPYGFETPVENVTSLSSLKYLISRGYGSTYEKLGTSLATLEKKYAQEGYSLYDIKIMSAKDIGLSGNEKYIVPIIKGSHTSEDAYTTALNSIFKSDIDSDGNPLSTELKKAMENIQSAIQTLLCMDNAYFAIGDTKKTMTGVTLLIGLDGAVSYIDCSYGLGDGTVPYASAEMLLNACPANAAYFDLNHGDLANGSGSEWNKLTTWIDSILNSEPSTARTTATAASPYTVIRVACPVDVIIERNGEILTNIAERYSDETSYGVMDLLGTDGEIKMFCLDNDDYSITLTGTDTGTMDYAIRFYSAEGELVDERVFEDVPITETTVITTNSTPDRYTELRIDENGDGVVDQTMLSYNHIPDSNSGNDATDYVPVTPPTASSANSITAPAVANGTITVSPSSASKGATVTVTATPDAGYELSALTVTDASGNGIKLTDKGNGTYTFTMPASKVTVTASFAEIENEPEPVVNPFTDVFESDYYYDAVLWAAENGITEGTSAAAFSPDLACTRAQIVTFLWRAAGSPEPAGSHNPFTDVKDSDYYYEAVLWAAENGVTEGTSATTFSPDLACTRDQAVTFLWRAAGKPAPASNVNPFTDVKPGQYYTDAVLWAAENSITEGTGAAAFSPGLTCTRAQIVTFLYRSKK